MKDCSCFNNHSNIKYFSFPGLCLVASLRAVFQVGEQPFNSPAINAGVLH
jgi:hypothetical protein